MEKVEYKQLLVRIEPELHRRLKVYAAKTGQTMAEVVATAVGQFLARHEREDGKTPWHDTPAPKR